MRDYTVVHSIFRKKNTLEYFIVFNKKWNQYAPIGGKIEKGEDVMIALLREIEEEVTGYELFEINFVGTFDKPFMRDCMEIKPIVALYEVVFEGELVSKEDFIEIIKLEDVKDSLIYEENAYTCLEKLVRYTETQGGK